ncbi:MAG: hypothetical protein KGZ69_17475 [Methylomonas sp.]|nr:hypothetical protein [Methylomonas sp.]
MKTPSPWPKILLLGVCSALAGCATQTSIPAPVPPPLSGHTIAAPLSAVKSASLQALQKLGFSQITADDAHGTLISEEHTLAGNTAKIRNAGIARLSLEKDIYPRGTSQLTVSLLAKDDARQTEIRPVATLRGLLEKRGDIQYAPFEPATEDAAEPSESVGVWEPLTSNGVLEDRFLAALLEILNSRPPTGEAR